MRLKKFLPLTLLLVLATQTNWAQSRTESKQTSASEYGIDLNRNYTGSEVEALLNVVAEEADAAIDRAFDEGYKQGLLASVPEAEFWKAKCAELESEIARKNRTKWIFALGGFGAGFFTGGVIGLAMRIQN